MTQITHNLMNIQGRIVAASERYERTPGSVRLLAVSKRHPASSVIEAFGSGQTQFGENFVTESVNKQAEVNQLFESDPNKINQLSWHFIGRIQSNKTRQVAQHFSWVHSLDRIKIARRLNDHRQGQPLNVLVQVNLSENPDRPGVEPNQVEAFLNELETFEHLALRGLMAMAPATDCFETQSSAFSEVKQLFDQFGAGRDGFTELSMGMSGDLEAAIANGSTWVRIGTDVFGKRPSD
ncbi:MAG: YggS family pyridoxal phosphate-dependent enzyme [Gammaproteobacteria bacterium]